MLKKIISILIFIPLIINCSYISLGTLHEHDDIQVTDESQSFYVQVSNKVLEFEDNAKSGEDLDINKLKDILFEKAYITEDEQTLFENLDSSEENIISDIISRSKNCDTFMEKSIINYAEWYIGNKLSGKISKNLGISLGTKDVIVYIAETNILCAFKEGIYSHAYMYLDNGRINKSVACMVDGHLYMASNINNESITYNDNTEDRVDFEITEADREEYMRDLLQGLIPRKDVHTLEDIAEYIKSKHLETTDPMTIYSTMFGFTQSKSSNHSWGSWTSGTTPATGHSLSTHDGGHVAKVHFYIDKCNKCTYSNSRSYACSGPPCAWAASTPLY